MPAMK